MTSTFPNINSKQMVKVAVKLGFEFVRQGGSSHAIYRRHKDGRRTIMVRNH